MGLTCADLVVHYSFRIRLTSNFKIEKSSESSIQRLAVGYVKMINQFFTTHRSNEIISIWELDYLLAYCVMSMHLVRCEEIPTKS